MDTVADVKYESIKHLNRAQKADAIMREYDKKFKGGIERKDFGFIVIRKDEITNSLKYLHTDGEFAAFKALPQVLKRGKIIDEHINHKGRTIDTVTIATPVIINGTSGYMAAAVKVGGKNRYHIHRILMPDGSEFEFNKKTEPIGAGMITVSSKQGSAISSVSDNSINQSSKNDNKKFSIKDSDTSRTITVTTIRGETKTITGTGKNLLTGEAWNEEQWEHWKRSMEADYIGAETTHEAIESEKYLYAPYQEGTANAENFMWNTVAMFEGVK